MKKITIIAILLLSTALTALSISRKTEEPELKVEKSTLAEKTEAVTSNATLATAD